MLDTRTEGTDVTRSAEWYRTATRWTQVTFTDDDPGTFDIDFWVDVMRRTRSNALCLSAGGYMAFYPTEIPYHHRSKNLGDGDPFGDLVDEARRLGMHVMARVDPHAIHEDAFRAHPEWAARTEDGDPIEHDSMPGVYWTDPFSTYLTGQITEIAQEITRRYDIDAVFANRWETVKGVSYAEPARRRFRDDTGFELPSTRDLDDPAWPVYAAWRRRKFSELVGYWDDAVRAVKPHVRFIPNRNPGITRDLVRELIEDRYPILVIDKQGRWDDEAAWTPGRIGKRARGLFPDRPIALLASVGTEDHVLRWKDSVTHPHELRSYIADGFVQGGRPWFSKFKADVLDTRWVAPVVEAFEWHARCEPLLEGLPVTAEVALLDTRAPDGPTPWQRSDRHPQPHEDGVYQALVEARIPFEYVADETLSAERLEGIRVLVLPACPDLAPEHVAVLEDFVARGGSIVAAYDSSVTGDDGARRFALGDVLGVRLLGDVRGPIKNNYITIEGDHPVAHGYDGATRIVGGTRVLEVEAAADADVVFRFIPDYPDLPMEEVYPRRHDGPPAVVAREHASGGRTVYVAFDLGALYWRALQADHGQLIANAVRWALGEERPHVTVLGQGLLDIAVRAAGNEVAVGLVNLNHPMAMRGQAHELLPLRDQEVVVRLPAGVTTATARLVVADRAVPVTVADGAAHVRLERLEQVELVHLSWLAPTASDDEETA
ncbi:alpha-amylase family protein [Actinotalea caeni]|uniref:alpha-amylase family protein n=1 Tax=Actinotalea caeni TaxID=1348467 RepID=UPI002B4AE93D|nr:alpha-amylase family protein [Actinotalea caeni]